MIKIPGRDETIRQVMHQVGTMYVYPTYEWVDQMGFGAVYALIDLVKNPPKDLDELIARYNTTGENDRSSWQIAIADCEGPLIDSFLRRIPEAMSFFAP